MRQIQQGKSDFETYKNRSFSGFSIPLYMQALNVNETIDGGDFVKKLQNVIVKGTLTRGGKEELVLNDNLRNILYLLEIDHPSFEYIRTGSTELMTLRAQAAGVKHLAFVPLQINLGSVINLKGNDTFKMEVSVNDGFFGNRVDTAASYLQMDMMDAVGVEYVTPVLKSLVIPATTEVFSEDLGDGVCQVVIANYDKTAKTSDVQVLITADLNSDKMSLNDNYLELNSKGLWNQVDKDAYTEKRQNYQLYKGLELNKVNINLQLNSANVAASMNYILFKKYITNQTLVERAFNMKAKHDFENLQRVR